MASCVVDIFLVEDSTNTLLGRLTSRSGSGAATGKAGEGNFLKQADISTITCKVFDLEADAPTTPILEPSVVIAAAILDTPDTTDVIWTKDAIGYNFIHDLPVAAVPLGDRTYRIEYKITLTGGEVQHAVYEGPAVSLMGS